VTIMASYGRNSVQSTLTVTPSVGTLPQFTGLVFTTPNNAPLQVGAIVRNSGVTYSALDVTVATSSLGAVVNWNNISFDGQTLTFSGLNVTGSTMFDQVQNMAQITSGSLTVTLTPQGVPTSGTIAGSVSLTSTLGTISGSFTGTYTAQ
jgi:hypothetical protein